ncbi:CsbD family protein [Halobacillus sp. Marseille-Q1614]|uniref:CsbD family protein n=1 Tax=Halobacillus sp. Marseille-Q1614 TaxID=2709134 RepID=UPI00156F5CCF|nr:CsbD family protein [Halobacillus sp. Marseille-Q1614]
MADRNGLSDKVKGNVNKTKGEVRDQVGNAKNDPEMQSKGKKDRAKGDMQKGIGNFKDKL